MTLVCLRASLSSRKVYLTCRQKVALIHITRRKSGLRSRKTLNVQIGCGESRTCCQRCFRKCECSLKAISPGSRTKQASGRR